MHQSILLLNGGFVRVTASEDTPWCDVLASPLLKAWVETIDYQGFEVKSIYIQSVDIVKRGQSPHIIFIKLKADIVGEKGETVTKIVFLRGPAVAMLVVLRCEGRPYTILTHQPRFAIGKISSPEIAAGTLDGSGDFVGAAAREIEEELGITINADDLFDLTEWAYKGRWPGMYPSAGACDEFIKLYLYERDVSRSALDEFQGKLTGLAEENEHIKLSVIPLDDLPLAAPDAKALGAYCLYRAWQKSLVPAPCDG